MNIHVNETPPLIDYGSAPVNLTNILPCGSNQGPTFNTAPTNPTYGHPLDDILLERNDLKDISPESTNKKTMSKKGKKLTTTYAPSDNQM